MQITRSKFIISKYNEYPRLAALCRKRKKSESTVGDFHLISLMPPLTLHTFVKEQKNES